MQNVPGPKDFSVRLPAVAGRFYPDDPQACVSAAQTLLAAGHGKEPTPAGARRAGLGGIVPHAGWICSGAIAGQTLAELARSNADAAPELVVVFGAVHSPMPLDRAALDWHEAWQTPGGQTLIDPAVSRELVGSGPLFAMDERFHRQEHAVEVELPLIQAVWPNARLLPIEVPLIDQAERIGRETAQRVLVGGRRAVFLASSDLTHYGPAYRFVPAGVGKEGLAWAKANDRRVLDLVMDLAAERVVPEVRQRLNACGGGAIAAVLAACKEAGAKEAKLLRHASSYETLAGIVPDDPTNAVGYASVVVQ